MPITSPVPRSGLPLLRTVAVAWCLAALSVGGMATAGAPKRVQTRAYDHPHGAHVHHYYDVFGLVPRPGELTFQPPRGAGYVRLDVADEVDPNGAMVWIHQDNPAGRDLDVDFCGVTDWYRLMSREVVSVWIYDGICANHNHVTPVRGTVTATFSRSPGTR